MALTFASAGVAAADDQQPDSPSSDQVNNEQAFDEIYTEAQEVPADGIIHETDGLRWKVVEEEAQTDPRALQPRMKVGAGKFLYLYVDTAEFNGLSTAGGVAYTGVVCGMITAISGPVAVGCTAITSGIFAYLQAKRAPKSKQCGEIKLAWGIFAPVGYKVINKPCNKI